MISERFTGMLGSDGNAFAQLEPLPELVHGHILVKVHASLVSPGTELDGVREARQSNAVANPDAIQRFGYQNAGEIIAVADDVKQFKPGDRVACMGGGKALHSNYTVVPQNLAAILPDNVTYEQGAFMNLALTALNVLRRGEAQLGEYVLCAGLGLVGQMTGRLARLAGAYVMGWDLLPQRCHTASQWAVHEIANPKDDDVVSLAGKFTRNSGFDLAVLSIPGDNSKVLQSVRSVMQKSPDGHEMGRLCMVGGYSTQHWGAALGNLDLRACSRTGPGYHDKAWENGDYAYPTALVRWHTRSNMEFILQLISEGRFSVEKLITHRFALEDINEAVTAHLENADHTLGTIINMQH